MEANAWSTAAVVWGADAVGALTDLGVAARLVDADGSVTYVGHWPADAVAPGMPAGRPSDAGRRAVR